jgi:putative membrane protein
MLPMSSHRQPPGPRPTGHADETGEATRRTRLANERTYLAWWRTGLTSLAVGLGAGRLIPALSKGARWPYTLAGVAFAGIGMVFIAYAFVRHRRVEQAIARGEFAPLEDQFIAALAAAGVLLAVLVLILVLLGA